MGARVKVCHQPQLKSLRNFSVVTDSDRLSIEVTVLKTKPSIGSLSPSVTLSPEL
jgi:hypothetical protein